MKKQRREKGITLVALAVTIIVLIILATVSINIVFNENGIIKKAEKAKQIQANATIAEQEGMDQMLDEYVNMMTEPPESSKIIKVKLSEGMTPVKWNGTNWERTTQDDTTWYNYASNQKKWANVVLKDATFNENILDETKPYSQLVWIPRYAYKITSQYHQTGKGAGNIEIAFINTADRDITGKQYSTTYPKAETGKGMADYVVHPAFNFGNDKLDGIWVGKYENSFVGVGKTNVEGQYKGTDKVVMIKSGVTSWRNNTIGNMFNICLEMNQVGKTYGLSSKDASHLMKDDEWGACAYLSTSKYGKNSRIEPNMNTDFITGIGGTKTSSTGNEYGIYDLCGGASEIMASYLITEFKNVNKEALENAYQNDNTKKYVNVYTTEAEDEESRLENYASTNPNNITGQAQHYGDAIWETTTPATDNGEWPWYGGKSFYTGGSGIFRHRGGEAGILDEATASIFSYSNNGGSGFETAGFRTVISVIE